MRVRQPAMMIMFLLGIDPTVKSAWRVLKMLVGSGPTSGMNFTDIVTHSAKSQVCLSVHLKAL